ncbi:MAG: hypothetical protein ACOVOO_10835 [Flavobacteriales bacterium]|jgi:hypothetical protein
MSSKILSALKQEIAAREKELHALVDAANLIAATASGRGRKAKFSTGDIDSIVKAAGKGSPKKKGSGKRGRPKGSKNKPGAKKPGPKTAGKKTAAKKAVVAKAKPGRPAVKKAGKAKKSNAGRPRKSASTSAAPAASSENA